MVTMNRDEILRQLVVPTGGDPEFSDIGLAQSILDGDQPDVDWDDLSPEAQAYLSEFVVAKYSPDEPRDDWGRWTSGTTYGTPVEEHAAADVQPDEGGFSVHLRTRWAPSTGYMVALPGHEEVYDRATDVTAQSIRRYIERHSEALGRSDAFLGGWHDGVSGKVFLDVSIREPNHDKAVELGHQYHQLAIFHLDDFTTEELAGGVRKAPFLRRRFFLSKDPADADECARWIREHLATSPRS